LGIDAEGNVYSIGHCKDWEKFHLENHFGGKISLKSHHGSYLGVNPQGNVYAIGRCKDWEKFDQVHL
jgi:hypothetical protein